MNLYITTEEEERLLSLPYLTQQLLLREKKSISKLQIISWRGLKALKSIEDSYRKFRIVIASVLIKIYHSFNSDNEARLDSIKNIIYSASLKSIQDKRGIERGHLLKSVAKSLRGLKVGLDSEAQVIGLFNTSPFFDEILMRAFCEYKPELMSRDSIIRDWLEEQLKMSLNWDGESSVWNERSDELSVVGVVDNGSRNSEKRGSPVFSQYVRFCMQDQTEFEDEENFSRGTNLISLALTPEDRSVNRKSENGYMMMSIDSASPNTRVFGDSLSRKKRFFRSGEGKDPAINADQLQDNKSDKEKYPSQFTSRTSDRMVKVKRKKDGGDSVVWKYLCCSFSRDE